jgi:transposase
VTRYTEKQKLAAVTAYRKGVGGLRATASAHDVGVDSLRAWIAAYEANGKAGLVAKRRVIYDLDFKLEVLRRMQVRVCLAGRLLPSSTSGASTW